MVAACHILLSITRKKVQVDTKSMLYIYVEHTVVTKIVKV